MNKKQKILAILGLGLVLFLFLINTQVSAQETPPPTTKTETTATTQETTTKEKAPEPARPGFLAGIFGDVISWVNDTALGGILWFMSLLIGSLAALAATLGGWLTNFAFSLNYNILNNFDTSMIKVGWEITRDLANLGFVLFIIIIAIATILRIQQYGAKDTLVKLIAVALLVNFSLVFAGIFIDFSNMLTYFFAKNIAGGTKESISRLGESLISPFGVQRFLKVKNIGTEMQTASKSVVTTQGLIEGNISLLLIAILTFIAAFCLIAVAIMFLIRYIILSILLILVPLACLSAILPATKKLWNQWTDEFMKWILFAPVASFFLYLGVYLMNNYDTIIKKHAESAQGIGTSSLFPQNMTTIDDLYGNIARVVITGGFMIGGLIIANKLGIFGAKALKGAVVAGTKGLIDWTGKFPLGLGAGGLRFAQKMKGKAEEWQQQKGWARAPIRLAGRTLISGIARIAERHPKMAGFRPPGLLKSTLGAMKKGSGLFKKKGIQLPGGGIFMPPEEKEEKPEKKEKEKKT